MLSKIIAFLGDPADVRSIMVAVAALVATLCHGTLGTQIVTAIDAGAALVIAIDQAVLHKRQASTSS